MKKIHLYLCGGLGNQLFQIFTGISYSIENNIVRAVLKAQSKADNAGKVEQIVKELTNLTIGTKKNCGLITT